MGKSEKKEMLVSDFFYISLASFLLIISIIHFQPFSQFFCYPTPLHLIASINLFPVQVFAIFPPYNISFYFFLLFSICYSKFPPSIPKLLDANKHLKKYNIFLYYEIDNRAAPTTEEVIFTFTLQFFFFTRFSRL